VLGNYVILDKLGQGGMGMVLKAEHRRMERIVALKMLSAAVTKTPEALARFQREVKAAAKLEHPNIVTAYDADEAGGTYFLVMQYVEGSDLSALVREKGPLSVEQAVTCIVQAARGLEYAHQRGVVHRDIKPSNLLLAQERTVKILDMGLARLESAGDDQDQLTGTGQIMGTVDYMAPEQALDTRHADARADIYALGITLWFLLTGRGVYQGESVMAKLLAHREAPIPSLPSACPDAPPPLDEIFARMVAKEPDARYQTMGEVIADLEALQSGGDSTPSLATAPGDDSRLNAFLSNLQQTSVGPAAAHAVAAKQKKTSKPAPTAGGYEPTVALQSNQVDTDPQSQMSIAAPPAPIGTRSASKVRRTPAWVTGIPRSRVGLFCAAGGAAVLLLAALVFFVQTGEGVIRVEINDPQIEVAIQGTDITLKQADQGKDVKLSPGEKTLIVQRGDFRFETDKLILKRGETVTVRVELLAGQVQVHQGDNLLGQGKLPRPPLAKAPFDADEAKRHQQAWANYLGLPVERDITLPGGEKLTLVLIPPGEFLMGSTDEERAKFLEEAKAANDKWTIDHIHSEGPQHRVRITKPFYLGKYEVTQAQWEAVTGSNPSQYKDNPTHPVETVSWDVIQPFLAKLNDSGEADKMKFALATEAQWEYACRAGTTTAYYGGESTEDLREDGWFSANSGGKTHPVGALKPNGFGLYDMHGNVWEWCADWYAGDYYAKSPEDDPTAPFAGSSRVLRGGCWYDRPRICRSAFRHSGSPEYRLNLLGFRLASVPAE